MSSIAAGSRRQLLYCSEGADWGDRVGSPDLIVLRNTGGAGIQVDRNANQSEEFRVDRAIADMRLGVQRATLQIPFELSYGTFDAFLAAAMFGNWSDHVLEQGAVVHSFNIEEGYTDIDVYLTMLGAMVDTMALNLQPEGRIVTGNFGLIGKKLIDPEGASADQDPIPANTNGVFDSFNGFLQKDGESLGVATSLTLNIANNLAQQYALFENEAFGITAGRANITGSITAFFTRANEITEFLNETESSLAFELEDLDGNKYTIEMPRVKWSALAGRNITENEVTQPLQFQALYDESEETTIAITRTAGA